MNRRELLKAAGLFGLSSTLPVKHVFGKTIAPHQAFSNSFVSVPQVIGPTVVEFNEALPKGLIGTLYRNGPAGMHRGDQQYHHWFDGDGMIQSFRLADKTLTHKAKMVHTDRYVQEQAAGRFLWNGFGTSFPDARYAQNPDEVNVGNISVLPLGDELLALWEAGSAWSIDPDTLETRGRKIFSEDTDGLSFSAHPKVDPDGRIWNFGYMAGSNKLALYDINANGVLKRVQLINAANANMVHDFVTTPRYIIFVLMPVTYGDSAANRNSAFADLLGWDDKGNNDVLVIDKETLSVVHQYELPPFFAFHFGNAWEEGDSISLELVTSEPLEQFNQSVVSATLGLLPTDGGAYGLAESPVIDITLDTRSGRATITELPIKGADFPSFDFRYLGSRTNTLTLMSRSSTMSDNVFGFNQIESLNRNNGTVAKWDYGADSIAEEHIFVPGRNSSEGVGWLIGTVYNWQEKNTRIYVFDAQAIESGPIAVAQLPYYLPLGFHGKFVSDYPTG